MLGFGLGLRPQNSGLAFEGLGLECCGLGLASQLDFGLG